MAEDIMIETFEVQPETRWRFFTDGVMGGVSSGQVTFLKEDGQAYARMTGRVSTENKHDRKYGKKYECRLESITFHVFYLYQSLARYAVIFTG